MNSRREMFGRRRGLGAEGRNRFNVFRGRREGPRAPGLAHDSGLPQTGRGHPEPQSYRFESEAKLEAIVSGGAEMPGGRGEASSLAKERKVVLCSVVNFSIETMLKDHSTYQLARGLVKIPRQESYTANVPAAWAEVVQAPRGRGVLFPTGTSSLFPGFMESQQASATAQQPTRPKSRRAWEERKRAREASKLVSQKAQWSSSDNETSEEYQRKPRRKPQKRLPRTVSLRRQAESESPKESEGLSGSSGDHDEDMPSYPLTTFSLELKTNKEKQRRLEETSCKTKQSVTRDYPGAVAAAAAAPVVAAAAAGDMPRACPTKTVAEKKLIVGPSRVTLGRNIPSWRQTMKAPPVVPPISDISPFGSSKASSSLHAGPKQYKKGNNQKRFGSWGRRNSSSVSREGDEAKRNPALQAQKFFF
ncbi:uncharacterized protein RHO17_004034 isoform 2-T2 [Thomomys bottae]